MYKSARYILALAVVVLCLSVSSFGYAAIGAEPSNQTPETNYPSTGPLTSVPSYPGVIPGIPEGGTPFSQMYMAPSSESGMPYYPPPYGSNTPGYGEMPGMPYPPSYGSNTPGYGEMPGMTYPYPPYGSSGTGGAQFQYPPMYPPQYPAGTPPVPQDPYQSPWYPAIPGQGYPYPSQPQYESADQIYKQAMQAYRSRDYWTAMSKFREVATLYPQSDLADNAYYWMGEIHYAWKNFPAAVQSFQTVLYSYPGGNKVPDAMLKMGYAYAAMRQYNAARSILNDVMVRFNSNTRIRNLALKKLNELSNIY